jgi:hypothetical protein
LGVEIDVEDDQVIESWLVLQARQDRRLGFAGRALWRCHLDQDGLACGLRRIKDGLIERFTVRCRRKRSAREGDGHGQSRPEHMTSIEHKALLE